MTVDSARAKSIFLAASEVPDPAARADYLDQQCGNDGPLRARVEALLRADDAAVDLGDQPLGPAVGATIDEPTAVQPGTLIAGRYKLRQQIGEGGMGTVWMADQAEPVKRKVAVKLISVERGQSKTILARFEAERQAIALMDHPHIAKLLDAGTTETGSPFFVMELVKGIPLNDFCDQHKLTIAERLNLFTQICSAVQHSHQKGIIHRDLKPSNILVESHDGKPVPKVIDFGLAKATSSLQLTERSMFTAFGSVMGTPLYMAPEQANFNAVDIDTRADVYALGVILYELLTGTTPITRDTMKKAALDEMLKLIREQEAPTPSSRLSSVDSAPSVAASRQMEPVKLGRFVKGELDWIVLKALAKDRDRRYETANGFARDIERFLNHEPVTAGPPSARYRLQKFVQRNRGQVIAASLVLLALVAGIVGTSVGLYQANLARKAEAGQRKLAEANEREANDERAKAVAAAEKEKQAKEDAVRNLGFAKKGNELLGSVFTGLDPKANYATVGEFSEALKNNLKKAVAELEGSAIGDPLEVAAMQNTLGQSLLGLGEANLAVEVLEKARDTRTTKLGPDHPDTLTSMSDLAGGYQAAGRRDRALPLAEATLKLQKAKLGPDHPDTLTSMSNLAMGYHAASQLDQALALYEETLRLTKVNLGPDHPLTLNNMANLAAGYKDAGQLDKALPLFEETLTRTKAKLGSDHPQTLVSMNNLALGYKDAGQLDKALPLLEATLTLSKAKLGPDHPDTLLSMHNLAVGYLAANQLDQAIPLYEQTLKRFKAKLGPDHPFTLGSMAGLAEGYRNAGQLDKALPLLEESFALCQAKLGLDDPLTLGSMACLAVGYQNAGQLDKALPLLEKTLKLRKAKLGSDHPDTLTSMNNLALGYKDAGQPDKALPLYEETFNLRKAKSGFDHPDTLATMNNLAVSYREAGQLDKALPLSEETLKLCKVKLGLEHTTTLASMGNLATGYLLAGQLDKALSLFEETLSLTKAKLGPDHPETLSSMGNLASGYRVAGQPDKALPLLDETFTLKKAKLGPDHPDTLTGMSNLAVCYWSLNRLDQSIPLFEQLLALRETKLGRTHPDTQHSVGNLGVNYKDAGRVAEAIPLLEEAFRASKKFPALRGLGDSLLDAYAKAGKASEAQKLIDEMLADARQTIAKDSPQLAGALVQISMSLLEIKGFTEAEQLLRECLTIREKTQPDDWTTFNTMSLLGGALLGQTKYAEAEPLLLQGYEGIKARETTIPPEAGTRVPEALDRLIELYTATSTPDEVTKWQAERAKYPMPNEADSMPIEAAPMPKEEK